MGYLFEKFKNFGFLGGYFILEMIIFKLEGLVFVSELRNDVFVCLFVNLMLVQNELFLIGNLFF